MRTWPWLLAQRWINVAEYPAKSAITLLHICIEVILQFTRWHELAYLRAGSRSKILGHIHHWCKLHWLQWGLYQGGIWSFVFKRRPFRSHHVSSRTQLSPSHLFQRKCNNSIDNSMREGLSVVKWLMTKVHITLCSLGIGNWKTFAHLPHYPCYQHRRFPWQHCIQALSSRSGRHTASCSDRACISHCHCTNQGSHLVEEMKKISTRNTNLH